MEEKNPNQPHLDIELTEEISEGIYSNLAIITHSQSEFVIDFIKIKGKTINLVVRTQYDDVLGVWVGVIDNFISCKWIQRPVEADKFILTVKWGNEPKQYKIWNN